MKLEILKENLKAGLLIIERVVGKNVSLPALNNVLMNTEESFLVLTCTDLETAIKLWVLTKIIKGGKVAVPARLASGVVSSLPNEKITIQSDGQNMLIECKNFKTKIQGQNTEDFPLIPELSNADYLEVDNKKFCHGLSKVIGFCAGSIARPEISGIYISFSKNVLKIVATDSFRLGEKTILLDGPAKKDYAFILPQKPARELMNILDGMEGILKIYIANNQVLFEFPMKEMNHPQLQLTSRLIDGEYPNYQEIIPVKFKTEIIVKKDELLNQIKTASLFSGKVNEVKVAADGQNGELVILAKSSDVGESESRIPAKIQGDLAEVSFNYKYLMGGIEHIESSEITFQISKEDGPCILRPIGDASYTYVVMPIKSI